MKQQYEKPEIWAGIECTINRLQSGYQDQLSFSGHYHRDNDLDLVADLGITTLRYPVLWEKHQPAKDCNIDFSWASQQLERLRARNINPIVGLVHHGSGPEFTDLLDPAFPEKLAAYASQVANKFPWVEMYTPVNEPLTTARFSGLYGHWYPHERNDVSFVKMLINQLKAVVLSMRAIRKINPKAILVQTEDLGKTYSTPLLQYQAIMENHRRFLTQDILCGIFDETHPLWNYFLNLGIDTDTMQFFIDNPCPPDILGVNYYCTSERFLDEHQQLYPASRHGGNSIHCYADVEAVRVKFDEPHGFPVLLREIWDRYKIPIAVTEAHMNCSREGQLKWFQEIYGHACALKKEGAEIRSVTAWSIFGAYGWNKLLTCPSMEYERGAFDVSSGTPRPTALANLIKSLANNRECETDLNAFDGWWHREDRYFNHTPERSAKSSNRRPVLIFGKTGTLGNAFARACNARNILCVLIGRDDADICDSEAVLAIIDRYKPWAIINAAGFVRVDDAEMESEKCYRENTKGPTILAAACQAHHIKLVTFSSDLVFDGKKCSPYIESDAVNPLNVYGKSKAKAEEKVLKTNPACLMIRTSAFFSPHDNHNFLHHVLGTIEAGQTFVASTDIVSPTYVPHLADAVLDLLIDNENGIWHLCNNEAVSWYDFAKMAAVRAGADDSLIIAAEGKQPIKPVYSAMTSIRGILLPPLHVALEEYFSNVLVTNS